MPPATRRRISSSSAKRSSPRPGRWSSNSCKRCFWRYSAAHRARKPAAGGARRSRTFGMQRKVRLGKTGRPPGRHRTGRGSAQPADASQRSPHPGRSAETRIAPARRSERADRRSIREPSSVRSASAWPTLPNRSHSAKRWPMRWPQPTYPKREPPSPPPCRPRRQTRVHDRRGIGRYCRRGQRFARRRCRRQSVAAAVAGTAGRGQAQRAQKAGNCQAGQGADRRTAAGRRRRWRRCSARQAVAYAKAKPDIAAGLKVFEKNCATCHQIAGKGAKIGPQLDGIGVRGLDRLLEDVLDPNRNVDQAFRSTTLDSEERPIVTGLLLREEGEVIVMADAQGKEQRVAKDAGRGARGVAAVADAGQLGRPDSGEGIARPDGVFVGSEGEVTRETSTWRVFSNTSRSPIIEAENVPARPGPAFS